MNVLRPSRKVLSAIRRTGMSLLHPHETRGCRRAIEDHKSRLAFARGLTLDALRSLAAGRTGEYVLMRNWAVEVNKGIRDMRAVAREAGRFACLLAGRHDHALHNKSARTETAQIVAAVAMDTVVELPATAEAPVTSQAVV